MWKPQFSVMQVSISYTDLLSHKQVQMLYSGFFGGFFALLRIVYLLHNALL